MVLGEGAFDVCSLANGSRSLSAFDRVNGAGLGTVSEADLDLAASEAALLARLVQCDDNTGCSALSSPSFAVGQLEPFVDIFGREVGV